MAELYANYFYYFMRAMDDGLVQNSAETLGSDL